jgi:hypothetical protein
MPTFEPSWILYGLLGLGALILVARFGKLLVYGLLVVGVLGAIAFVADALRQQARATRQTATAATVAATGQTAGSVGQTVLAVALMLVLLGAAVAIGYLLLRLRRLERRAEGSQIVRHASIGQPTSWTSGPNAYWQRTPQPRQSDMQQAVQSLVQLELLRTLREMRSTAQISQNSLPLEEPLEDDDVAWGW